MKMSSPFLASFRRDHGGAGVNCGFLGATRVVKHDLN